MKECGIDQDDISIQNVVIEVETGILTKSSSATYYLSVRCKSLDNLGPTLAAIAAQKNTRLSELTWRYESLDQTKSELLQTAVKKAKATAQSISGALGTQCAAVHKLSYSFDGIHALGYGELSDYSGARKKIASVSAALQQMNLEHTTELVVEVSAEFVVAPFSSDKAEL